MDDGAVYHTGYGYEICHLYELHGHLVSQEVHDLRSARQERVGLYCELPAALADDEGIVGGFHHDQTSNGYGRGCTERFVAKPFLEHGFSCRIGYRSVVRYVRRVLDRLLHGIRNCRRAILD